MGITINYQITDNLHFSVGIFYSSPRYDFSSDIPPPNDNLPVTELA